VRSSQASLEATHLAVAVLDHALAGRAAQRRWGDGGVTPMAVVAELGEATRLPR
jgi:hypothetical protein